MKSKLLKGSIIAGALLLPITMMAISAPPQPGSGPIQSLGDIQSLVNRFVNWFAGILGLIGVLSLLYSGFLFMTGAGNEETQKKAKNFLTFGLIGIGVSILAFGAGRFVENFLRGV